MIFFPFVVLSGNQSRPLVPIRVVTLVNPKCRKMVNFSDNQSPFPNGLVASHSGARKTLDAAFLEGRPLPGALETSHLSRAPGDIPGDGPGVWGLESDEQFPCPSISNLKDVGYTHPEMEANGEGRRKLGTFSSMILSNLYFEAVQWVLFIFVFKLSSPIFCLMAYPPRENYLSFS